MFGTENTGPVEPWAQPAVVRWSLLLLDSYARWLGRELIERTGTAEADALSLYEAPFVLLSHRAAADPVLNYGNLTAQRLFEMDWAALTQMPSRLTAEEGERQDRARMLREALRDGWFAGYRGVRISRTGRRFRIEDAILWSVLDADRQVGQAATFARWRHLGGNAPEP